MQWLYFKQGLLFLRGGKFDKVFVKLSNSLCEMN